MPSRESLINELLIESVRARRRRLHVSRSSDMRLLGLKTVDAKLDRDLRALAVFGLDALSVSEQHLVRARHLADIEALVHLQAALVVQMADSGKRHSLMTGLVERHGTFHRVALRDAWWFYPVGHGPFDLRHDHVPPMLQSDNLQQQLLGAEIAGRLGVQSVIPKLTAWSDAQQDSPIRRVSELALARLGLPPKAFGERVLALSLGAQADILHALRLIAASGQIGLLSTAAYLDFAKPVDATPEGAAIMRLAWCLATLGDPAAAHSAALVDMKLDPELRLRVLALAGFPEGLVTVVRDVVSSAEPATAAQLDALASMLGAIPMQVQISPMDPKRREDALREAVLDLFRRTHVAVQNDADTCEWEPGFMLAAESLRYPPRLRFGHAIAPAQVRKLALSDVLGQMGPWMRQALYIEQSVQSGQSFAFGLSAYANARQQLNVIGFSRWIEADEAA